MWKPQKYKSSNDTAFDQAVRSLVECDHCHGHGFIQGKNQNSMRYCSCSGSKGTSSIPSQAPRPVRESPTPEQHEANMKRMVLAAVEAKHQEQIKHGTKHSQALTRFIPERYHKYVPIQYHETKPTPPIKVNPKAREVRPADSFAWEDTDGSVPASV